MVLASGDADVQILQAAVDYFWYYDTAFIEDDTDRIVLLRYHDYLSSKKLFFAPRLKSKAPRIWDIYKLKEKLSQKTCHLILFPHAILGCDYFTDPQCGKRPFSEEANGRCQILYICCSCHAEVSFKGGSKDYWKRCPAHDIWLIKSGKSE